MIEQSLRHQTFQNPIPVREAIHLLGHPTGGLDARLKQKVHQVEVASSIVIPILPSLHVKSNSGGRRVGTRVQPS